jgi:SAM-dependent methyltransferase
VEVAGGSDGRDEVEQLWSRSAEDERLQGHSHWRGVGAFADDRRWLAIGERTCGYVDELLREVHGGLPATRGLDVLEWGPGGGSNLVALAPLASRFVGVDVSAPNLEECGRQAAAIGFDGFVPVHLGAAPPTVVPARVDTPVDVVLSTSVFQHLPSVAYGEQVLGVLRELSHPGTVGIIQVRYEHRPDLRPATGRYEDDYLHGAVHPLADFWWSLDAAGFTPLRIVDLEHASRAAWFLFRCR